MHKFVPLWLTSHKWLWKWVGDGICFGFVHLAISPAISQLLSAGNLLVWKQNSRDKGCSAFSAPQITQSLCLHKFMWEQCLLLSSLTFLDDMVANSNLTALSPVWIKSLFPVVVVVEHDWVGLLFFSQCLGTNVVARRTLWIQKNMFLFRRQRRSCTVFGLRQCCQVLWLPSS